MKDDRKFHVRTSGVFSTASKILEIEQEKKAFFEVEMLLKSLRRKKPDTIKVGMCGWAWFSQIGAADHLLTPAAGYVCFFFLHWVLLGFSDITFSFNVWSCYCEKSGVGSSANGVFSYRTFSSSFLKKWVFLKNGSFCCFW